MLNSDLAKIYGYMTKGFNQQVKNNAQCFPSDFMIDDGRSQRVFKVKEFYLERATEERGKYKIQAESLYRTGDIRVDNSSEGRTCRKAKCYSPPSCA